MEGRTRSAGSQFGLRSSVRVDRAGALSRTRRSVTQRLARWEGAARRTRRRACTLFRCLRTRADRSIVCAMLDRQAFLANTGLQRVDQVSALPEVPPPCKRSEEHTSELQSLMRNSLAVF